MASKETAPILKYYKLTKRAIAPSKTTEYSAGYDLYSAYDYCVLPSTSVLVLTDLQMLFPSGTYGRVAPRSGLALHSNIHVGGGVIDRDYTGNVGAILYNNGKSPYNVRKGERVAQIICEKIEYPVLQESMQKFGGTVRGEKGFGSSGK